MSASGELRSLIAELGKIPPELRKALRPALYKAADPILQDARRRASWSTRIPGAIRLGATFSGKRPGLTLVTRLKKAEHARVFEHAGEPGTFRHPVFWPRKKHYVFGKLRPGAFNDGPWVPQEARPFFFPALKAQAPELDTAIADTIDEVARLHGFR